MSKVLKVAGMAIGIVAVIASGGILGPAVAAAVTTALGVSAGTLFLVSAGLTIGSSLLSSRPKAPDTSQAMRDRLQASINPRALRTFVFGSTAMATDIRDQEFTNDQEVYHRFIVVASHAVHAIREIWFDDKLAWTIAGGAQGEFAGYLTVTPILEGSAANAINISPRMGSSRRYTGLAYLHLRYKLTGNSKKAESPFAQSVPSRITIVGDGIAVYDPRLDSTVGGDGPQRANDQTTWTWNEDACRNPALVTLTYMLGWRIRNPVTGAWKLAVGKGIPPARIDIGSFITAANLCDEPVTKVTGGTEPRYRCDGVFNEGDDLGRVLDNFKAAMNAEMDDVDGRIRITVLHNDLTTPIAHFETDDILGEFTWDQTPPLKDTFNIIRGGYTDPSSASLYQLIDYPEVAVPSPDGIDRPETINLPLVESPSQAQRLIKQRLQRAQYPGTFGATFQVTGWKVVKGDYVTLTFKPLGWVRKKFRVADSEQRQDGTVPMVLREEHPDIYAWDADEAPAVQGADPTTFDQGLSPVVRAIRDNTETTDAGLIEQVRSLASSEILRQKLRSRLFPGGDGASIDTLLKREFNARLALAQLITTVSSALNGTQATVQQVLEAMVDGDEGYARFMFRAEVVGSVAKVVGLEGYVGSGLSAIDFLADRVRFIDPDTGEAYIYMDDTGRLRAKNVIVDTLDFNTVGTDQIVAGAAQRVHFITSEAITNCPYNQNTVVATLPIFKADATSVLEVQFFGSFKSGDDLFFDGKIVVDGTTKQSAFVNITLDTNASLGQMPITPFAFVSGVPAGEHTVTFEVFNREIDGPALQVLTGSTLKVVELKKPSL